MTMDELKPGESAYIETVGGSGALRHHLLDMGLTPDAEITLQKVAPMGDPVQFEVRGYELTLRLEEARKVTVKNVHKKDSPLKATGSRRNDTPHPGVGEFAKYEKLHLKHGIVLEKGAPLTFALAGNQNCGKQRCSISLQAQTSTSETSLALRLTARTELSEITRKRPLRIYRASIRFRLIRTKK